MLKSLFNVVVFGTLAVIGIIGLFIAWWIAVIALLAFAGYVGFRRLFPRAAAQTSADGFRESVVIEGQFEVEPDATAPRRTLGNTQKSI